jgi:tetratricopeptide (TPR) repeat protein
MRTELRLILSTVFLSLSLAASVRAQVPGVGQVSFPNSGAAAAQQDFLTGLAQLHNFEYGPAAEFFRRAQQADPNFAMAYWGEAMTHTHAVWMEQDAAAARAILLRLGPAPQARLEKAKTEREKDYLRAVEVLYGDGEKKARDFAYADAMAGVHRKYPDDIDAAAFTALALLGTAHDGRDFAIYMRSAAILEPLFPSHQKHPGIAHYLIHSYDDPVHAPLGLRAAREYSKIAPSAAHAQHMCSHIFVAIGMWDDVVEANEAAVKITRGPVAANRPAAACGHYPSWLTYGYLQQGRVEAARTMVTACHQAVRVAQTPTWGAVAAMRSRYLLDTEEWSGEVAAIPILSAQPAATFTYEFTNAFSAIRRGELPAARAALAKMQAARQAIEEPLSKPADPAHASMPGMATPEMLDTGSRGRRKILQDEITAMIRHQEGAEREAIDLLRAAAALEDTLPFEFGPPFVDKPAYELLGEILLANNQPKEARAAFEKALGRTPDRTAALVGLMKAAAQLGDRSREDEIRARLQAIWHRADRKATDLQR